MLGISKTKSTQQEIADAFKAVRSDISNMTGGAGNLEPALEQLEQRDAKVEAVKAEKIDLAVTSLGAFLHTVKTADQRASQTVGELNEKFYEANPWAVPPKPPRKKKWWEKLRDFFKKVGKAVAGAFKKAVDWVVGVAKKIWTTVKNFVVKHWKAIVKIVIGVVVIAGLAALSVFTGGAAAPLFAVAAKGAAIAAGVGAATSVVSGVVQGKSFGEIFDSCGDAVLVGAVTGAVGGFAGAAAGSVASATGSQVLGELTKIGVEMCGKMIAQGTSYLIDHDGSLDGFWAERGKGIVLSAGSAAGSAVCGELLDQGKELLGGVYDGLKDSQLGHAIQSTYEYCKEQAPVLTNIVSNAAKDTVGNLSWNDLSKLGSNPADFAKSLGSSMLGNMASQASGAIGDFVTNDLNNITGGAVNQAIDSVKNSGFGQAVGGAMDEINNAIGGFKGAISDIAGSVNNVIGDISGQISGAIGDISGQIGGAIGDISQQISGAVGSIGDQFKGVTGALGGVVSDIASQIGGSMPSIQMPSFDSIGSAVSGAVGNAVSGVVGDIASQIGGSMPSIQMPSFDGIGSAVSGAVGNAVSGAVGDITSQIGSAVNTTLPALGKVQGVIGGIQGNLGLAVDAVTSQSTVVTILPDFSKVNDFKNMLGSIGMAATAPAYSLSQATTATVGGWMSTIRL